MTEVHVRNSTRELIEACYDDFGRFAFDGFGVMLSDEQLEAAESIGTFGPRKPGEPKNYWLSGGQRSGKTVLLALKHADGGLYKRGLDAADRRYWRNYAYGLLAIAPIDALAMRLWAIMDELSKGSNNAQWDSRARRSRGGAFLSKIKAGKLGPWGIVRFSNGSFVDFRSSEGRAYRLEGGQWWGCTWDEWASQPEWEIEDVATDVLLGRLRDHDAKMIAMAWPKPETEHHLIRRIRQIEKGEDTDSRVIYLSAEAAYFTNRTALAVERRTKDEAKWKRTVLGQPAGGAAIEFKTWMVDNARVDAPFPELPKDGFAYFTSWDVGMAHDATVGITWRIPIINGRRTVTPKHKARIVAYERIRGGASVTVDTIGYQISARQALYRGESALDATSMGGVAISRDLADMKPPPMAFVSRANDRVYGNMRLAAITNGLQLLTWGRPDQEEIAHHMHEVGWEPDEYSGEWGVVEIPNAIDLQQLVDELLAFDRDAKHGVDDSVWAYLIGAWYVRRFWLTGNATDYTPRSFDVRPNRRSRGKLIRTTTPGDLIETGQVRRETVIRQGPGLPLPRTRVRYSR